LRRLPRERPAWVSPRSRDLTLAGALAVAQLVGAYLATQHHHPVWRLGGLDVALLLAGPAALLVWRRYPVAVMWVTFLAALGPRADRVAYLSLVVAFFLAATGGHRRAAWVMLVAGYVVSLWIAPPILGQPASSLGDTLSLGGWLALLGVAAEAVRIRRERIAAAAAARLAEERVRAGSQRLGIARELHDVIGHNISLINLQAGIGLDLFDTRPQEAREALAAIREVSGEALDELRAMLASLRDDESQRGAPRAPSPGLDQLPELVEPACSAGLSVAVQRNGTVRPMGGAVELAAYRIVQESLTNVARHAPRAKVTIDLTYTEDALEICIRDGGSSGHRATRDPSLPLGYPGSGIAGMRERAESLGGSLDAHRRLAGGFEVTASLPTAPER